MTSTSELGEIDETAAAQKQEPVVDQVLLAAVDTARAALAEITDPATIGELIGHEVHDDHVLSLHFACLLPGYPDWRWTATLSRLSEDDEVNVLEVELLRGEDSVIAPDWVPWSERLAQYRESQAKLSAEEAEQAAAAAAELADEDDAEDDLLDNDHSDFDDELDGVNVDGDDDDDSDDDDESEDESDDDESGDEESGDEDDLDDADEDDESDDDLDEDSDDLDDENDDVDSDDEE